MKRHLNRFRNWLGHIFDFSQRFRNQLGVGDLGATDQEASEHDHGIAADDTPATTAAIEPTSQPARIESSNSSPVVPTVVSLTPPVVDGSRFTDPEYVVTGAGRPVTIPERQTSLPQQPGEKNTQVTEADNTPSLTEAPASKDQPKIKVAVEEQLAPKPQPKPPELSEAKAPSKPQPPGPVSPPPATETKAPVASALVQPPHTAAPGAPVSSAPVQPTPASVPPTPVSPAPAQPPPPAEPKAPVSPAPVQSPPTSQHRAPVSPAPVQPPRSVEPKATVSSAPVQPSSTSEPKATVSSVPVQPSPTSEKRAPVSSASVQPPPTAEPKAPVTAERSTTKTRIEVAVVTKEKVAQPQQTAADLGAADQKSIRKPTGETKQLNVQVPDKAPKGNKPQRSNNGSANNRVAQQVKAGKSETQRTPDKPKATNVAVAEPNAPPKAEPEGTNSSVSAIRSARGRYAPGASTDQTAQRLARLLISEIKLYNKAEVEGATQNVYDILKEPIDKARKYYGQRLGATVVESMPDYFHDELVRTLCAGDPSRLGPNYKA